MAQVRELTTEKEFIDAYPIMSQLRTGLSLASYLELLAPMKSEGYQLFAVFVQDRIVAVAGVAIKTNFFHGRHVYVFELVTDQHQRSAGYGKLLLDHIEHWAKENGATYMALDSGLQRVDAHRFYESKIGLEKWCYSFHKTI